MKYQYFICSRWRNKPQILELLEKLKAKGKTYYCFLETAASADLGPVDQHPEEFMKSFESLPDWRTHPKVKAVFESDMQGLRDSEALILLLPGGKSAHIEAGAAYGMGKKLISIGEQKETESTYLIFNETYQTIDAFISNLA